ncbi:MAG: hypothetical protein ACI9JO_000896, partial [Psychrobacter okhotskensis]
GSISTKDWLGKYLYCLIKNDNNFFKFSPDSNKYNTGSDDG